MTNYKTYDLVPLEDHILVEPLEVETTTKSGIILPTNKDEKPACGVVIAVGPGKILDNGQRGPMDVSVGDIVYFTKYSPDEIELDVDGEKVKVLSIKHSSILAKRPAKKTENTKTEKKCCGK